MAEALIGLAVVAVVALLLGAGWAAVLQRASPGGWLGFIFLAWSIAIVISTSVWSWTYSTGHGIALSVTAILLVALAGYALAWRAHSYRRLRGGNRSLFGLAVAAVVVLVALVPAYSSWTRLSMGDRIGPDGAGYAISARSISEGTTRPELTHQLLAQVGGGTLDAAVSPRTKLVDTTPSVSVQAASEFLLGADRWGFPGVVGTVVSFVGPSQLWAVLSILAAFGLLTAAVGVWSIVKQLTGGTWPALVAVVLLGLSPALLNAWHEGALAQVWILPACVLFGYPLVRLGRGDRFGDTITVALAFALMLAAFNDAMLIYAVVFGLCALLSLPMLGRLWWTTWWPLITGAVVGSAMVAPSSVAFVTTLRQSLSENGTAGWQQPRWLDIAEAFGLHNAFASDSPGTTARSGGENISQAAEAGLVTALVLSVAWRRLREPAFVLLTAVICAAGLVYVKTRYVDHATNYQYFKTIALLVPLGALAIGMLVGRTMSTIDSAVEYVRGLHSKRLKTLPRPQVVLLVSFVTMMLVLNAAVSYVSDYRSLGTTVPTSFDRLSSSSSAKAVFARYNILSPTEDKLLTFDVAAEVDLNWIGRNNEGNPATRLTTRMTNPVGLLVFEKICPRFSCLDHVDRSNIAFRNDGVAVVEIEPATRSLAALPETDWSGWLFARLLAIGGVDLATLGPVVPGGVPPPSPAVEPPSNPPRA